MMKSDGRIHVKVLIVTVLAAFVFLAVAAAARAPRAAAEKYPPQFPREGATKLFENDRIIVWEQVGRPRNAFVHRHVRDTIVFGLEPGRVQTQGPDGKINDGTAERSLTTTIRPGTAGVGSVQYTTAGLGPHAEVAPDPNSPKSIFIELKGSEPKDCGQWSTACRSR
jgi:hypothetical protein